MNDFSLYIGIFAGVCTSISLLPQLVKIIKEKKAENVSLAMYIVLLTGVSTWIVYGVIKNDYPIIVTNGFSFIVNLLIIIFSIKYKKKR